MFLCLCICMRVYVCEQTKVCFHIYFLVLLNMAVFKIYWLASTRNLDLELPKGRSSSQTVSLPPVTADRGGGGSTEKKRKGQTGAEA